MDKRSDVELIKSIQLGEISLFETIVKRYQRQLYSFVYKILKSDLYCEDVVQETFFKVYKNISRIDTSKKFSTYLFGVAKNTAIDYLRKSKANLSIDKIEIPQMDKNYERVQKQEIKDNVLNALGRLENKYSKVLKLYYFKDLGYEEIGKNLRLPVNTVRTRIRRGKLVLGKILSSYAEEI